MNATDVIMLNSDFTDLYPRVTYNELYIVVDENWHNSDNDASDYFDIILYNTTSGGANDLVNQKLRYYVQVGSVNDPPVARITITR